MTDKNKKPEWAPRDAGAEFTSFVMPGVALRDEDKINVKNAKLNRRAFDTPALVKGVLEGNVTLLSKAITLIESSSARHVEQAQNLLKELMPHTGKSIRIGITGPPGTGKSTFIDALGTFLCRNGFKVAVLAIDPSSARTRGSILGDKTRMESLLRETNAFIRPSPAGATLGGVAKKTRETILLCEAAGYDVIIIETVGVGQSEVTVRSMVDFFLLLLLPGGGDELQGIKKGIVELADGMAVNKADGDNVQRANLTRSQYSNALSLLAPATEGWKTKVVTCSALEKTGLDVLWSTVNEFVENTKNSGVFDRRRREQIIDWVYSMVEEDLKNRFYGNPRVAENRESIERQIMHNNITPAQAVQRFMELAEE